MPVSILLCRRIDVDTTSFRRHVPASILLWRRIDVDTLFRCHVPAIVYCNDVA